MVIKGFDISCCQFAIENPYSPALVKAIDDQALELFQRHQFFYNMSKFRNLAVFCKRISKYLSRGYMLVGLKLGTNWSMLFQQVVMEDKENDIVYDGDAVFATMMFQHIRKHPCILNGAGEPEQLSDVSLRVFGEEDSITPSINESNELKRGPDDVINLGESKYKTQKIISDETEHIGNLSPDAINMVPKMDHISLKNDNSNGIGIVDPIPLAVDVVADKINTGGGVVTVTGDECRITGNVGDNGGGGIIDDNTNNGYNRDKTAVPPLVIKAPTNQNRTYWNTARGCYDILITVAADYVRSHAGQIIGNTDEAEFEFVLYMEEDDRIKKKRGLLERNKSRVKIGPKYFSRVWAFLMEKCVKYAPKKSSKRDTWFYNDQAGQFGVADVYYKVNFPSLESCTLMNKNRTTVNGETDEAWCYQIRRESALRKQWMPNTGNSNGKKYEYIYELNGSLNLMKSGDK